MSADNGIYILEFPTENGEKEFRVAHAQAIENITWDVPYGWDYHPEEIVIYFGSVSNAARFTHEKDAIEYAYKKIKELYVCEYGIQLLRAAKHTFEFYKRNFK
jgi:hypothetical protein